MKLEKSVVDRRIQLMEEEGVKFVLNTNVGKDITAEELLKNMTVILACGASNPRDIKVPGRDAKGIYLQLIFLEKLQKHYWILILKKYRMNLQRINMFL